jgi:hypothetical protein
MECDLLRITLYRPDVFFRDSEVSLSMSDPGLVEPASRPSWPGNVSRRATATSQLIADALADEKLQDLIFAYQRLEDRRLKAAAIAAVRALAPG